MDAGHIMLGVGLVGVGGVAVWALIGRAGLQAARAGAEADARHAHEQAQRLGEDLARERGMTQQVREEGEKRLDAARDAARAIEQQRAELEADLSTARVEHKAALESMEITFKGNLRAVEMREAQLREQVDQLHVRMQETFRSLAAGALEKANTELLKLADERFKAQQQQSVHELEQRKNAVEQLVKPIAETLSKTEAKLGELDRSRASTAAAIGEQMKAVADMGRVLKDETSKLVNALKRPEIRGRYGEIQLRRVAELAGMTAYCDFDEQTGVRDAEGRLQKPDMTVRLPNERIIAVDAKTNIAAYIDAVEATTPEQAETHLNRFAAHVAEQVAALSRKGYWERYDGAPEFVVMFVPGDQFIDAALQRKPELIEQAAQQRVILASPSTLIGLLRAVAVGWREQRLEKQAQELFTLGQELHDRAAVLSEHLGRLGGSLEQAVKRYNDVVGSYEGRLEPTLRRFEEAGARSGKQLAEVECVTVRARLPAGQNTQE